MRKHLKNVTLAIVDCLCDNDALFKLKRCKRLSIPVLTLINNDHLSKTITYALGATDYLSYPIQHDELSIRVRSSYLLNFIEQPTKLLASLDLKNGSETLVKKTSLYLTNNLNEPHTLGFLATVMGTNRNTLASSFKEITGLGVMSWLRNERMAKAKHLLSHSNLTIQQICYEVGYEDPANFATSFKQQNQISPSNFRKMSREQGE